MSEQIEDVQGVTVVADTVRCKRFIMENDEGGISCEIGTNAKGSPEIVLFDADGNRRAVVGVYGDTATVALLDKNSVSRLALQAGPKTTGVALRDIADNVRGSFGVSHEGDTGLLLLNREKKVALSVACRDSVPQVHGFDLESNPVFWVLPEPEPANANAAPLPRLSVVDDAPLLVAIEEYNKVLADTEDAHRRWVAIQCGLPFGRPTLWSEGDSRPYENIVRTGYIMAQRQAQEIEQAAARLPGHFYYADEDICAGLLSRWNAEPLHYIVQTGSSIQQCGDLFPLIPRSSYPNYQLQVWG